MLNILHIELLKTVHVLLCHTLSYTIPVIIK